MKRHRRDPLIVVAGEQVHPHRGHALPGRDAADVELADDHGGVALEWGYSVVGAGGAGQGPQGLCGRPEASMLAPVAGSAL